jgi:hypothetical protein
MFERMDDRLKSANDRKEALRRVIQVAGVLALTAVLYGVLVLGIAMYE